MSTRRERACRRWQNPAYRAEYKRKHRARRVKRATEDPATYLWQKAKKRARQLGVAFSIEPADIIVPTHCPVFGIAIGVMRNRRGAPNSASLDRRNASLGYVPGNVVVISSRANTLKRDATIDELKALVRFFSRQKGVK